MSCCATCGPSYAPGWCKRHDAPADPQGGCLDWGLPLDVDTVAHPRLGSESDLLARYPNAYDRQLARKNLDTLAELRAGIHERYREPPTGVAYAEAEVAVQRAVDAPTSLAGWGKDFVWWGSAAEADAPLEPAAGDLDTLGGEPPDWTGSTP